MTSETRLIARDHPLLGLNHAWSITSLLASVTHRTRQRHDHVSGSLPGVGCLPDGCQFASQERPYHELLLPRYVYELGDQANFKMPASTSTTTHASTIPVAITILSTGTFAGARHAQQLLGAPRASQAQGLGFQKLGFMHLGRSGCRSGLFG